MKVVMMVCNRNVALRTTFGSIQFLKDIPRQVGPNMVEAAIAIGVIPVDPNENIFSDPVVATEPTDVGTRNRAIENAIEDIIDRNHPDDFAGGSPKTTAVQRVSNLKKVSASEIKKFMSKRNEIAMEAISAQQNAKRKKIKGKAKVSIVETEPPEGDDYDS